MTVTVQTPYNSYTYAGSSTFVYKFQVLEAADLQVSVGGVVQSSGNYTVSGLGLQDGGSINYTGPLTIGQLVELERVTVLSRTTDYQDEGDFLAATINADYDRLWMALQEQQRNSVQAIRVPETSGTNVLPAVAARANLLLSFDSFGNPTVVAPASGTSTALALLLASSAGGNNIGLPSGTLANFLANMTPLSKFGTLHNDGATDDYATCAAAMASGAAVIDARGLNLRIGSTLNIPINQTWLLQGTTISLTGTTLKVFSAVNVDNWNLVGPFKIVGDGSTAGSAYGIFISNCTKWRVIDPTLVNIRGWGMWNDPGANTRSRSDAGSVINPVFYGCYVGWQDAAGTGAEFCSIVNIRAVSNTNYGVVTCAGNTIFTGGHIVDNVAVGMLVTSGPNSAHGMATGLNINHNGTFGLHCDHVLAGMTFTGCHFYQSSIWLDCSKGINITGGHLDCIVYNYKDGSSGMNVIENMYCPGGYGVCRQAGSNNGHDQLIMRDLWGPGAYAIAGGGVDVTGVTLNDPSTCYAIAQRDPASTQALTSGVAATLTFGNAPFADRRLVLNLGAGTFTVPADQPGLYDFDFTFLFGGTAMSNTGSFVELKVNGVSKQLFEADIFSTTKLQVRGADHINLSAGDVVTFVGTIVGTAPTFGDSTWPSKFQVSRRA